MIPGGCGGGSGTSWRWSWCRNSMARWQASPGVGLARQPEAPTHDQADPLASVAVLVIPSVDEVG